MTAKELLDKYVAAVLAAPESLHLTATRDPREFWHRHVLDALKLIELFPLDIQKKTMKAIDIGSGNGIPGIPTAVALPHWQVDLLDTNSKKCGFLDMFCKFNGIENVTIITGRAEQLGHGEMREDYDIAFARALGKLPVALELASPFVKVHGTLVVPHGTSWRSELDASKKAMKELGLVLKDNRPYKLDEKTTFMALIFEKTTKTAENYPRKVGLPAKKPL